MTVDLDHARDALAGGDVPRAHAICEAALKQNPHQPIAIETLIDCLIQTEQYGVAYHLLQSLRAYRDDPDIWHNLAACLSHENPETLNEAVHWLEKSLNNGGSVTDALCQLACVYTNKREPDKAIHHAEAALRIDPKSKAAKWNAALALLMKREWKRGWEWYDETIGYKLRPALLNFAGDGRPSTPLWDGDGGTVVISSEQGLGDEIMFASCVEAAISNAETAILQCDPRLCGLYKRSFPRAVITPRRKDGRLWLPEPREITHTIPIGSLGRLYRNRDADFLGTAYLKADPERCIQWRSLLDTLPGRKIGVMWQGGVENTGEERRSITLPMLQPILSLPGFSFVSLNHRNPEDQIERFAAASGIRLHHWKRGVQTDDYDDTAALIHELDAVVTVTSTIAHISGALGKATNILVPFHPQWRYGLTGNRMPWYQSARLYRQPKAADWETPIAQIAARLRAWEPEE